MRPVQCVGNRTSVRGGMDGRRRWRAAIRQGMTRAWVRQTVGIVALSLLLGACADTGDSSGVPGATRSGGKSPAGIPDDADRAEVLAVTDGDTISVRIEDGVAREPVRFIGVDTPEKPGGNRPPECYGAEASQRTATMLPPGAEVFLERDTTDRDRFDRLLRYVWYIDARDGRAVLANEALVREGYAIARTYPPDDLYADRLARAEDAAQAQDAGLWAACGGADTPLGDS